MVADLDSLLSEPVHAPRVESPLDIYRRVRGYRDPVAWSKDVLKLDPDPWQKSVLEDASDRQILVCARQVGKSTIVGVKAAHYAVSNPESLILVIAPSQRQSRELLRKIKAFFRLANIHMPRENESEVELENHSRILALPGSDNTVRGFSAVDLVIIDEAAFASDKLFYSIQPMVQISRGSIVLLSSAYATRGFYYQLWEQGEERWSRYRVTAYDCPRYDPGELELLKASVPQNTFKCEYLAEFVDPEGAVFTADQIAGAFGDVELLIDPEGFDLFDDTVEPLEGWSQ